MLEGVSQPIAEFLASILGGTAEEYEPKVRGFLWILIILFAVVMGVRVYKWFSGK